MDNNLEIKFTNFNYHYFNRLSTIGIYCNIENKTHDTLLLNREEFFVTSQKGKYLILPLGIVKDLKVRMKPNIIKINPKSTIEYVFNFGTENKMSKDAYKAFITSDTVSFEYKSNRLFNMIGRPRE